MCWAGGQGGEQIWFNGTYVSEGTVPAGSMWAKIPAPWAPWFWADVGMQFEPMCEESPACAGTHKPEGNGPDGTMFCRCSGRDLPALEIVDR
jgi:hypothetical protein